MQTQGLRALPEYHRISTSPLVPGTVARLRYALCDVTLLLRMPVRRCRATPTGPSSEVKAAAACCVGLPDGTVWVRQGAPQLCCKAAAPSAHQPSCRVHRSMHGRAKQHTIGSGYGLPARLSAGEA